MIGDERDYNCEDDFENECYLCGLIGEHAEDCALYHDKDDMDFRNYD